MAILEVYFKTGSDDLRRGSWANLTVKLATQQEPLKFERLTEGKELKNNSDFYKSIDVPGLEHPGQLEYFQIEHVSQEGFGQTRDNWNIEKAEINGRFWGYLLILARHGYHRFTGSSASLTILSSRN